MFGQVVYVGLVKGGKEGSRVVYKEAVGSKGKCCNVEGLADCFKF